MCGFLAEFSFNGQPISDIKVFTELLALSKHRGPDATGITQNDHFQLGFNRLSILDLSINGNQPKQSPSGRYHVVFNGEIYNFMALAEQFQLKNLSSSSDTEVLVHLFDRIGIEETIKSLNGMFAIAIVDIETNAFYMARDFAGIKPLFYGINKHGVVAASQFDQLFKHIWFKDSLQLRPEIIKEYFGFGYMQAPNTIYKDIFQLNPGEFVTIEATGKRTIKQLVSFDKKLKSIKTDKSLSEVLKEAVSKQLVSDVSVATFLSGGIDSPIITAYAKKAKPDIEAFTLKVEDPKLNESEIAKIYAQHLGVKQQIVSIKETDITASIDAHFSAFSEPFGDYSSIPTYIITQQAKKYHTVMLSGDGGDELFYGYPRMLDILNKRWWFKLPFPMRKRLAQITNKFGITKTWAPYFRSFNDFIMNKHLQLPALILDKAIPNTSFSSEMKTLYLFKNNTRENLLHQLRWNEFYAHMQRVLVKVDRASMKHSLEVRVPFLDKKVIEFAWTLSGKLGTNADLKKDLKTVLAEELPEELINKHKMGFAIPMAKWFRTYLKADVMAHIFDKPFYGNEFMDVTVLQNYTQEFFDNKHSDAWGVWHIYAWQKWAVMHL